MVRISMEPFVRQFQADKYLSWAAGMEVGHHPELSDADLCTVDTAVSDTEVVETQQSSRNRARKLEVRACCSQVVA